MEKITNHIIHSIKPDWPADHNVHAHTTMRFPGGKFGTQKEEERTKIQSNRQLLQQHFALPNPPLWLQQIHSNTWTNAKDHKTDIKADACYSEESRQVCVVYTADCLPILLCHRRKLWVAAIHAGWRGLARDIIAGCPMSDDPCEILAWLGPAISAKIYEVGVDVHDAFLRGNPALGSYFKTSRPNHWMLDLYGIARHQLRAIGITNIYGGNHCTYSDERFFSHRQEPNLGQMASFIWVE